MKLSDNEGKNIRYKANGVGCAALAASDSRANDGWSVRCSKFWTSHSQISRKQKVSIRVPAVYLLRSLPQDVSKTQVKKWRESSNTF